MADTFSSETYKTLCNDAEGYLLSGASEQARELLLKAIALIGTRTRARNLLADTCMSMELWPEAREQLEILITLEEGNIRNNFRLGQVLEEVGENQLASDNYSVVLDVAPDHHAAKVAMKRIESKAQQSGVNLTDIFTSPGAELDTGEASSAAEGSSSGTPPLQREGVQVLPDVPSDDVFARSDDDGEENSIDKLLENIGMNDADGGDDKGDDMSQLLENIGVSSSSEGPNLDTLFASPAETETDESAGDDPDTPDRGVLDSIFTEASETAAEESTTGSSSLEDIFGVKATAEETQQNDTDAPEESFVTPDEVLEETGPQVPAETEEQLAEETGEAAEAALEQGADVAETPVDAVETPREPPQTEDVLASVFASRETESLEPEASAEPEAEAVTEAVLEPESLEETEAEAAEAAPEPEASAEPEAEAVTEDVLEPESLEETEAEAAEAAPEPEASAEPEAEAVTEAVLEPESFEETEAEAADEAAPEPEPVEEPVSEEAAESESDPESLEEPVEDDEADASAEPEGTDETAAPDDSDADATPFTAEADSSVLGSRDTLEAIFSAAAAVPFTKLEEPTEDASAESEEAPDTVGTSVDEEPAEEPAAPEDIEPAAEDAPEEPSGDTDTPAEEPAAPEDIEPAAEDAPEEPSGDTDTPEEEPALEVVFGEEESETREEAAPLELETLEEILPAEAEEPPDPEPEMAAVEDEPSEEPPVPIALEEPPEDGEQDTDYIVEPWSEETGMVSVTLFSGEISIVSDTLSAFETSLTAVHGENGHTVMSGEGTMMLNCGPAEPLVLDSEPGMILRTDRLVLTPAGLETQVLEDAPAALEKLVSPEGNRLIFRIPLKFTKLPVESGTDLQVRLDSIAAVMPGINVSAEMAADGYVIVSGQGSIYIME